MAGAFRIERIGDKAASMGTCPDRRGSDQQSIAQENRMIRKLSSGKYRLYSRKTDPKTGRRRNLGTFATRAAAEKHERAVQYFKRAK
jgi:hypothetical protein